MGSSPVPHWSWVNEAGYQELAGGPHLQRDEGNVTVILLKRELSVRWIGSVVSHWAFPTPGEGQAVSASHWSVW